jgi:hypothetical protein
MPYFYDSIRGPAARQKHAIQRARYRTSEKDFGPLRDALRRVREAALCEASAQENARKLSRLVRPARRQDDESC